ncbi:MAG: peptide chain release factor N(5)-glutamine methyltransferase [Flavobacterium sp.]|uniref:peptide chain release factor N(5)-glutamine methyltransferase n=1 Tax=Flavobacterium sp. TaxID=239 RepID=UPI0011FBE8B1|nr:peptide chain release factor N(5)-glutamine methyltransferase [Flavobacterium sp.]RZJ64152.1 MAG: peptide chain release factor N(5)-glutamine methyltransferase [Flavobacterium sp.]
MLVRTFRDRFILGLTADYDAIEAESFFYLLLEDFRGLKRVDLAMDPNLEFSSDELQKWDDAFRKLQNHIPIQYIIGSAHFFGLEFEVNPSVLIPRPETEELVDWIVKDYEFSGSPEILDIGTGSGCIAISLAKNLHDANVSAIDVSSEALDVANRNANRNEVRVDFIKTDILKTDDLSKKFDIIVSNPPYVRNLEKREIKPNVLENEPHLALFVADDDALVFYRKIADLASEHLSENGKLYFEINQYLSAETIEMLESKGFHEIELRQDIYGNDRMIKCAPKVYS